MEKKVLKYHFLAPHRFCLYKNQVLYMKALIRELGYKIIDINKKQGIFKVNDKIFRGTSINPDSVVNICKDKLYCKSLTQHTAKLITSPEPNMIIKPRYSYGDKGVEYGDYLTIPDDYIAEQRIKGILYRVFMIEGIIAGCVKQTIPKVIGDGQSTVRELIDKYPTYPPFIGKIIPLETIDLDQVLKRGQVLETHFLHSYKNGGLTETCFPPQQVTAIAFEVFNKIPDLFCCGIDIILDKNGKAFFLEINSQPGVGPHYYPSKGRRQSVLEILVDKVLKEKK